ncbi:MAG TPA: ABC transporter ATP-binding protein, partial [Myxococcaceae bacterium]|nr:ABC transporter ATP-binding protein [Myxococcaceae bacterium]
MSVFRQVPTTLGWVWRADPKSALGVALLTALAALLPAAIAYVGKLIVDAVVLSARTGLESDRRQALTWVAVELGLMAGTAAVARTSGLLKELLRAKLGYQVNVRILEKALELELRHFEDSEVYDKMQNARREASSRPLALVLRCLTLVQNAVTLGAYAVLLIRLSPWAVLVLFAASVPAFVAEAKLAGEAFRLNSWRAPEGRKLNYLEWILTRDSHVKEIKIFGLGEMILGRYKALFRKFFDEDRRLAVRKMGWGLTLGLVSLAAFYACYAFIAGRAASGRISLGDMTLYLMVFRQGQSAFQEILTAVGSMYEDALFMSNLETYFAIPTGGETA